MQTIKATKDIGLDILAYDFAFIGSGVYSWLPGKPLMELIGRLRERYAHAGEIKPASPRRPGKKAVVILPGDSDGFVPLFGKRSFIEKQDCLRISQVFVDHWMVLGQNESLGFTKRCIARTFPPAMCKAIGSIDFLSSSLNWPLIYQREFSLGSLFRQYSPPFFEFSAVRDFMIKLFSGQLQMSSQG